jgi:hypothetical protein
MEDVMATIIAGRFETQEQAQRAVEELEAAGFTHDEATTFFVNPRGQHDQFPVGGDQYADAKATDAGKGAAAGAVIGGAAGLAAAVTVAAAAPVLALGVVALGAYTGSLAGALSKLGGKQPTEDVEASPGRKGGVLVAAHAMSARAEDIALETLRRHGAADIERRQGVWEDGDWKDFDPVAPPELVDEAEAARRARQESRNE